MGIGKAIGAVFKGVGWIGNEIFKEATGIDIKEAVSPVAESYKEARKVYDDIKEFEENKESYIREHGEEAYDQELEYLRDIRQIVKEDFEDAFLHGMKYDVEDMLDERKREYEDKAREKIANMSDKQIRYVLNKKEISSNVRKLLEEECRLRGI